LIFGAALAIRLYDLTDLPLDFHPTRQLLSVIRARGLYYQTKPEEISTSQVETAVRMAKLKTLLEPVVFERLVAFTYRFTGEQLWIARVYSSLFWVAGGIFLFLLARKFVAFDGALVATAYYLIYPYAIIGSRSFQPDPLMVMLILAFWWMFSIWCDIAALPLAASSVERWRRWLIVLLAGLLGGTAIFIKPPAVFFVIGGALGLALSHFSLRDLLRNTQVWIMALLGALPASIYLVNGVFIRGNLAEPFSGRFVPELLVNPYNYLQWATLANMAAGGLFIMLGLLGLFLTKDRGLRIFLSALWASYILFGLFFDYHIATHDYYHLPFIPIVALSLMPLGEWLGAHIAEAAVQRWMRGAVYLILLYGVFSVLWDARNQLKAVDYRPEAGMWREIGELLDDETPVIALTQDYGSRLQYWGWETVSIWPYSGDAAYVNIRKGTLTFDRLFNRYSSKMDYFLVTDLDEFDRQLELKERLTNSYQIFVEGDGYLIFDLNTPKQQDANSS